jgi:hypothetical protein
MAEEEEEEESGARFSQQAPQKLVEPALFSLVLL